eukprot:TRINITY_DN19352_c0_g1_i1.p2 TRINITY_DN19352_c0_g1~~TRINITY_DN19352_c0_g1_i1.p2  ORF type:complete len:482 (+),score=149.80 TRINITY_DN19352_c0_g1_i1:51-1496(+)
MSQKSGKGVCLICGGKADLQCGRCKSVYYCSADHQKKDWKRHKAECKDPSGKDSTERPPPSTQDLLREHYGCDGMRLAQNAQWQRRATYSLHGIVEAASTSFEAGAASTLDGLKQVQFADLTLGKIQEGTYLVGELVVPAFYHNDAVHSILVDQDDRMHRVALYNCMPSDDQEQAQRVFPIGKRIAIVRPLLRKFNDGWPGVRVDDPQCVVWPEDPEFIADGRYMLINQGSVGRLDDTTTPANVMGVGVSGLASAVAVVLLSKDGKRVSLTHFDGPSEPDELRTEVEWVGKGHSTTCYYQHEMLGQMGEGMAYMEERINSVLFCPSSKWIDTPTGGMTVIRHGFGFIPCMAGPFEMQPPARWTRNILVKFFQHLPLDIQFDCTDWTPDKYSLENDFPAIAEFIRSCHGKTGKLKDRESIRALIKAAGQKQTFPNVPPQAAELVDEFISTLVAYEDGYAAGMRQHFKPELNPQGIPYQQRKR